MTDIQLLSHTQSNTVRVRSAAFALFWLALASELVYLFLLALVPLPALHLIPTPLSGLYPWLLQPSRWLAMPLQTLTNVFGGSPAPLLGGALIALGLLYLVGLSQLTGIGDRRWLIGLLGGALVFGLTLLLLPSIFSDNVFTSMFAGRTLGYYHLDPFQIAPIHLPNDAYASWIQTRRDQHDITLPLWLYLSTLFTQLSSNPATTLLLFKGFALLAHLLNIVLVWSILSKIAPKHRLSGALIYAWNPLVLIELAGNGQSEGLLMLLLLLATWCTLQRRRPVYALGALLCFGLAISTNMIALLLAALYAWFIVDHTRGYWHAVLAAGWRILTMLLPLALLFLPLWHGATTFFALTSTVDVAHFIHSPIGLLALLLRGFYSWFAHLTHMPAYLDPITSADMTVRASATFVFVLIYLRQFGTVRDASLLNLHLTDANDPASTLTSVDTLIYGWISSILWYLLLVSGWFWPGYILWLFWAVALRRRDAFSFTLLILTSTTPLLYTLSDFNTASVTIYQIAIIFGPPLVYFIGARTRERLTSSVAK
ncbi:hypothetical protein [Ktedonospora formicarum]|uniref:Uncharacterized protein n=1 Tax=Ktedonospora formicarum TaxID=2778364 RepID=A0A8J3HVI3_9CHLR|nr:hypothetical protein [Ktedonospora formicarum]GHO44822.1 hypothetical protein KSX_29850 [Ktedonospora formicarum]